MKLWHALSLTSLLISTSCIHSTKVQDEAVEQTTKIPYSAQRTPTSATELAWFSAYESHVKAAPCRIKLPSTSAEIERHYSKLYRGAMNEGGTYEVFGVTFEDERPELVLAFSKLLQADKRSGPPENEQAPKNLNDKFRFDSKCKKVLCAAKTVFGKEVGPQMIFLMEKFDVNTSHYSFVNSSVFRADEISDVIRTFELLSSDNIPLKMNQQLTKFSRGYTRSIYGQGSGVLANAVMELFDGWSEDTSLLRQATIYHEFAHNYARQALPDYDKSQMWLAISGWKAKENSARDFTSAKAASKQPHNFVSRYGKEDPFEDFAESVTAYRMNSSLLKKASKEKYDFIKHFVFNGVEFDSAKNCQKEPEFKKYQVEVDKNTYPFSNPDKDLIKKVCRKDFFAIAFSNGYQSTYEACVNFNATELWLKKRDSRNQELAPRAIFNNQLGISHLHFKKLAKEIAESLAPEATDWLIAELNSRFYQFQGGMSQKEYCDAWTSAARASITASSEPDTSTWAKGNYPIRNARNLRPNPGALRSLCHSATGGFIPNSKSDKSLIKKFLETTSVYATRDVLAGNDITRETLLKIIQAKTLVH